MFYNREDVKGETSNSEGSLSEGSRDGMSSGNVIKCRNEIAEEQAGGRAEVGLLGRSGI